MGHAGLMLTDSIWALRQDKGVAAGKRPAQHSVYGVTEARRGHSPEAGEFNSRGRDHVGVLIASAYTLPAGE